ncbi:hypothetical protein PTI45_03438 [Paenibacillus nuruki]|uniref:Uncharacterized protein n=2 Tax=Paenibacillus nuruki TaxID=1886670 RepID=A0A1E3KZZ5_9BACL|nr:hypothetical protein PTI45_03438 [Paenibacillus nuruki]
MKDFQDNSDLIQLKYYFEGINCCEELENQKFIPQKKVAFNIIKDYQIYKEDKTNDFDYIVFSQSLSYTPKSADFIVDIILDYIDLQ